MQYSDQTFNPFRLLEIFRRLVGPQSKILYILAACLAVFAHAPITNAQTDGEAAAEAAAKNSYVLGVGDEVRITVHGEPDLTVQSRLNDSNVISYPFLGEIRPVGMTISQLEQRIVNGLRPDYLVNPQVSVTVVQYRAFYINGEVRSPGGYPYTPGLTVRKAVSLAGGFTERASTSKMYVVREQDPRQEQVRVNLETAIRPGDTLIIEEGLF